MGFPARFLFLTVIYCGIYLSTITAFANNKEITFYQCTNNQNIYCEVGTELIADEIAGSLKYLKNQIEEKQLPFINEPNFYIYTSLENFLINTGANGYMKAVVMHQSVHISPTIHSSHEFGGHDDSIKKVIIHELSHINLLQNYGEQIYYKIPSWFIEGLATYSSGGAGAESVTATQARNLLMEGIGFSPSKDYEFPTKSMVLKINPQIYYKQAEGFIKFIYEIEPAKFKKLITSIKNGKDFYVIFFDIYQMSVLDIWRLYTYRVLKEY